MSDKLKIGDRVIPEFGESGLMPASELKKI